MSKTETTQGVYTYYVVTGHTVN